MDLLANLPEKHFGVVYADPPWNFSTYAPLSEGVRNLDRSPQKHYETMKIPEIAALPVSDHMAKSAHCFLWVPSPHLPLGLDVLKAWGFQYSGFAFVWVKLRKNFRPSYLSWMTKLDGAFHFGLGFTTRKNVEVCILGRRGNARRNAKDVRELIISPRREHSRKPDEVCDRIERYCDGPYLELFGRMERKGWIVRGNEVGKFKMQSREKSKWAR